MQPPPITADSAAGVIARFLKARGVDRIFALCGGHIMPMWMRADAEGIRIIDVRDENGVFYFLDRKKNIIRRAGENIAAAEVEACLTSHDKVKQVAVLAAPDEVREEEVMACVIAKPEVDVSTPDARAALARELFDWCNGRMAYFKAPGWVLFVDSLPTGTSAKVQKIHIFPPGTDPRQRPGVIDLRPLKKSDKKTKAH